MRRKESTMSNEENKKKIKCDKDGPCDFLGERTEPSFTGKGKGFKSVFTIDAKAKSVQYSH